LQSSSRYLNALIAPSGYRLTAMDQGANDLLDSDADRLAGEVTERLHGAVGESRKGGCGGFCGQCSRRHGPCREDEVRNARRSHGRRSEAMTRVRKWSDGPDRQP